MTGLAVYDSASNLFADYFLLRGLEFCARYCTSFSPAASAVEPGLAEKTRWVVGQSTILYKHHHNLILRPMSGRISPLTTEQITLRKINL